MAPEVEAEEQVAVAPQAGAAAPEVPEVCGKRANRVRQLAVGRVAAVQEAAEPAQAGLAVEVETTAVVPEVEADLAEDREVVGRGEVAEPEEAEELVAGLVRPASRASGWPRLQCLREACWEECPA